jgi:hypothetical protein
MPRNPHVDLPPLQACQAQVGEVLAAGDFVLFETIPRVSKDIIYIYYIIYIEILYIYIII